MAYPSPFWWGLVMAMFLASLFVSILAAIYGATHSRPFWIGYAIVGCTTAFLHGTDTRDFGGRTTPHLPTTLLMEVAADYHGFRLNQDRWTQRIGEARERLIDIGHAAFSIIFGLLGGAFGRYLSHRPRCALPEEQAPRNSPAGR